MCELYLPNCNHLVPVFFPPLPFLLFISMEFLKYLHPCMFKKIPDFLLLVMFIVILTEVQSCTD